MTKPPAVIKQAIGIDISASRQAGRLTWVAAIADPGVGPTLQSVAPAGSVANCGVTPDAVFPALADWIAHQQGSAVGVDSPFGLPKRLVAEDSWLTFLHGFPDRYPDPETFRNACRTMAGGRELRRACDREAKTPFAAYNLRLYRQTWWVIARLLRPLVTSGRARAAPMQPPSPPLPVLIEACPASLLKRLDVYRPYKGKGDGHVTARREIVRALAQDGLRIPPRLTRPIVADSGGDGLDAVVAGWAAWRAAHLECGFEPRNAADRLEARVYF